MIFLNPIWLLALAAISIPVVIHLWNIKPGKTLKVGSIALFNESSPKSSRSFKLLDILLLVLRCLLLILIAFLLATPLWQEYLKAGKAKGWVLIPKENYNETSGHFKSVIDSAKKRGYELHYFNKGFAKIDLQQLQEHPFKDSAGTTPVNYWDLVKQLQHQIPASVKAEIFTPNTITHFNSGKPDNGLNINWHTYTPADSVNTWLAGAWLTIKGNIRVMQFTATPTGTSYQYTDAASAYHINIENGVPIVRPKNDVENEVLADTATNNIAIYADKNLTDANYLQSALAAISVLTQHKTSVKLYQQASTIPAGCTWLFWLSDKSLPAGISAKNIFRYQSGKVVAINTRMLNNNVYSLSQTGLNIPVYQMVQSAVVGRIIWSDGLGNPVLSLDQGKTKVYHFYSRFNPGWSDLVWSNEFPKWLLALTTNAAGITIHDKRALSNEQLMFDKSGSVDNTIHTTTNYTDLSQYLWLVLAVMFLTERWLATKNNLTPANG